MVGVDGKQVVLQLNNDFHFAVIARWLLHFKKDKKLKKPRSNQRAIFFLCLQQHNASEQNKMSTITCILFDLRHTAVKSLLCHR